jgi:hypothetical protein
MVLKFRIPKQVNDLISTLGGSLGLFTGMAIIMLVEILELVWDLFYNVWNHVTSAKTKK